MPVPLLAHPFRLAPGGQAATVDQGSDDQTAQLLQVTIATKIGERIMQPAFGVPDPAWHGLSVGDVQAAVDDWGPDDVTIDSVTVDSQTDLDARVRVQFSRTTPDLDTAPAYTGDDDL